jgi:hypothetical protein
MMVSLPAAPERLIDSHGRPCFGNFAGPIKDLNHNAFDYRPIRRWPWTSNQWLARKLLKRWEFVGLIDDGLVFGCAVVHVHYAGIGFAYLYNRRSGQLVEQNIKSPFARGTIFSASACDGISCTRRGQKQIRVDNRPQNGWRRLDVDFGDRLRAEVDFGGEEQVIGITTVYRQELYGFGHTYKAMGYPARGTVTAKEETMELGPNARAIFDWSSATAPRRTVWNWAAASGTDGQGRQVCINFSTGLLEAAYSENTVWIDGQPTMLQGIVFDYNHREVLSRPWKIFSPAGHLELTFFPESERYEKNNFGFAVSSLHQPFGRFKGRMRIDSQALEVDLYGFCEEHFAKW